MSDIPLTLEQLENRRLSVEETKRRLSSFKPKEDVLFVVYESFKARSQGLDPHPKTYIGLLDCIREDGTFILGSVIQRDGEYRGFNPAKGYLIELRLAQEKDLS